MSAHAEASLQLQSAQRLLAGGERAAALDALLRAWRHLRCEPIARCLIRLGKELDRSLPRITGKSALRRHHEWLQVAAAGASSDVERLMVHVLEGTSRQVAERGKELARREADPRIARRLAELVVAPPWTSTSADVAWTQVFKVLRQARDPGTRPALEAWRAPPSASEYARAAPVGHAHNIAKVLAAIEPEPALDDTANELLVTIEQQIDALASAPIAPLPAPLPSADKEIEARLLAAAVEAFEDDQPRQVLADFWLQRGDPRGELMALQLKPVDELTGTQWKRLKALCKDPRLFVGELAPALRLSSVKFERGLLWACDARFRNKDDRAKLCRHPGWAPLRELACGEPSLLLAGSVPRLQTLYTDASSLSALLAHDRPFALERLSLSKLDAHVRRAPALDRTETLPRLKRLRLDCSCPVQAPLLPPAVLRWLAGSSLARNLDLLEVSLPWGVLPDLGPWLNTFATLGTKRLGLWSPELCLEDVEVLGGRFRFSFRTNPSPNALQAFANLAPEQVERIHLGLIPVGPSSAPVLNGLRARYAHAIA